MWRAVLVDDEEFVRAELTALFPWDHFCFALIGEAENAPAAMALIETAKPDLVITDIRMPETDGLELISWIGQRYPQIVLTVVSAYNDFQFVREALRLGAVDYLIKAEATPETAAIFLERVSDILNRRHSEQCKQEQLTNDMTRYHQLATDSFWRDALIRATDERELELQAEELGIDLKNKWYGLIFIHVSYNVVGMEDKQLTIRRDLEAMIRSEMNSNWDWNIINFKQSDFIVIANRIGETLAPEVMAILQRVAGRLALDSTEKRTISVSSKLCSFHDLPGYFREVREVNLLRFYYQEGRYIPASDLLNLQQTDHSWIPQLLSTWESMLRGIEEEALRVFINNLFIETIPTSLCPEEAGKLVLELINTLYRVSFEYQIRWEGVEDRITNLAELLYQAKSVRDWQILVEELVAHYIQSAQAVIQPQGSLIIRKALVYIQSNFTRDLTLKEVAGHVGVSKSYLSRIFPEYAGKHFCSYLQQLRIERAKELLRFTDDHIYEIASKVGFWNSRYFGKVFRDMVGMTPADYRRVSPIQEE